MYHSSKINWNKYLNLDFTDKTISITGGTRGIGAAIASVFCDVGANVVVTGTKKTEDVSPEVFTRMNKIQ